MLHSQDNLTLEKAPSGKPRTRRPSRLLDELDNGGDDLPAPAAQPVTAPFDRRLTIFRRIAAPLLAAASDWHYVANDEETKSIAGNAKRFAALVDSTVAVNHAVLQALDLDQADEPSRWLAAAATADIVAAHYRDTAEPLGADEATPLLASLRDVVDGAFAEIASFDEGQDSRSFTAHVLMALSALVSAVARSAMGHDPQKLMIEAAQRIMQTAWDMAARLQAAQEGDEPPTQLFFAALDVGGEFFREAYFNEMERLLEMPPQELRDYKRRHGNKLPLESVWEGFDTRMSMMETLTGFVPGIHGQLADRRNIADADGEDRL